MRAACLWQAFASYSTPERTSERRALRVLDTVVPRRIRCSSLPRRTPGRPQLRNVRSSESGSASVGSGWMDMPESQPLPDVVEVFPRLKERDNYK